MQTDEIYEMKVTDVSTSGDGIGRIEGMVTFVPGLIPGDTADVRITAIKKRTARGRIENIKEYSADRVEPRCPVFSKCGGCTLQNMSYEAQIRLKNNQLREKLHRIFGGELPEFDEPCVMENPWYYRNKAEYALNAGGIREEHGTLVNTGKLRVGFYDRSSRRVTDVKNCIIQSEAAEMAAYGLRRYIHESGISVYDEKTRRGRLRRMVVKISAATGEVMVILVINGKKVKEPQLLTDIMDEAITDGYHLASVVAEYNSHRDLSVPGKFEVIAGSRVITDSIGGLKFEISPQSFYQVNPVMTEKLYGTILEFAAPGPEDTVLDLYCGTGTIGLFCAKDAKYVWGVESVEEAVLNANRNAVINGIVNIQFLNGKAEEKILELEERNIKPDVVIMDPPRSGCRPELIESVLKSAPSRIVYVSCEPSTMARDLKLLASEGLPYKVERVKLVDQFCQTVRSEVVVLLKRINE
ncbi:MAG: 23S rRNA (uracil(1939)-C(5))-methyltransferase RlmD [Anaerovoracaceae bacterium]|jgi:23S rRNA (uracil1939-C5)-methyltransferase